MHAVSRPHRRAFFVSLAIAAVCLPASSACGARGEPFSAEINLIVRLPQAERRSPGVLEQAIRVEAAGPPDDRRAALVIDAPARVTWSERLGAHARLRAAAVLVQGDGPEAGVTLRIGVSDDRVYDVLFSRRFDAAGGADAWTPIDVDLSDYGGWQWSVFYRPWETAWRINVSVDAAPHGAIALDRPRIVW
jgi:hypothetical protein